MKDPFDDIATFVQVAEKRSFRAAATALGVSGSAVSQTLQQLEQRLGVRLLQRTTRSVGLTEAGERLYATVVPAFAQVRSALESLNELRDRPAGSIRLTVATAAMPFLYDHFNAFLVAYPDVQLDLKCEDVLADIVADNFDGGVRLGETLDKDMIAVDISGPQRMAVVAAPSYFAKHPKPKHPRDLLNHECVGHRLANGAMYDWEFDEDGKDFRIAVRSRLITNDMEHSRRLAREGHAISVLFEDHVREQLQSGELIRVLKEYCSPFPGFYLYYPARAHIPLKMRALGDFLRKRMKRRLK
jgi:DNA-binding transcriptional LysR family regulator